jgi:hypothetical protein
VLNTEREHITRQGPIIRGSVGWRSDFDGSTVDARLDNAIAAASSGDHIAIESVGYSDDRTVSKRLALEGTHKLPAGGATLEGASWTFTEAVVLKLFQADSSSSISLTGSYSQLSEARVGGSITVSNDLVTIAQVAGSGSITFESGTSGGIVDGSSGVSVTDNGTNTVGDIA